MKLSWKRKFELNLSILKINNKYVFKSLIGFLSALIGSISYMTLYYFVSKSKDQPTYFTTAFAGVISLAVLPLSLITTPAMLVDFRKSIFLRKLKTECVSKYRFVLVTFLYYFLLELCLALVNVGIFYLISYVAPVMNFRGQELYLKDVVKLINVGGLFFTIILIIASSISLGLLISIFSNSSLIIQLTGVGLIFISILFGGQLITISEWKYMGFMPYLSLISPISYPINGLNISTLVMIQQHFSNNILNIELIPNQLFQFSTDVFYIGYGGDKSLIFKNYFKPIFIFLPFIYTGLFVYLSMHFFKFTKR